MIIKHASVDVSTREQKTFSTFWSCLVNCKYNPLSTTTTEIWKKKIVFKPNKKRTVHWEWQSHTKMQCTLHSGCQYKVYWTKKNIFTKYFALLKKILHFFCACCHLAWIPVKFSILEYEQRQIGWNERRYWNFIGFTKSTKNTTTTNATNIYDAFSFNVLQKILNTTGKGAYLPRK